MRVSRGAGALAALTVGGLLAGFDLRAQQPIEAPAHLRKLAHTYSIVAWDPDNGDLGVAVQSKFLAVGAVVPWAKAGVGAIATQAWANTSFGPDGLALMANGTPAQETLDRLVASDPGSAHRQVGVVDGQGQAATFTGSQCMQWAGGRTGSGYACQGNILVGEVTIVAMAETFEQGTGGLWDRMVAALAAGQVAGGDSRGQQSAALLVVREGGGYAGRNDRFIDLRVDDHPAPIDELQRLLDLHKLYLFPSEPTDLLSIDEGITCELQTLLQRQGHFSNPASGVYDEATQAAMRRLIGVENLEERWREDGRIDWVVLEFLRRKFGG
jgi:uncharacterized Ntn-hydrolase superfamily protein